MRPPFCLVVALLLATGSVAGADGPTVDGPIEDPALAPTLEVVAPAPAPPTPPPVESASRQHAHRFLADPFLLTAAVGAGVEPSDRGNTQPVTFQLSGQALWRGIFGLGLGLYASEGQPVLAGKDAQGNVKPSLGDRVSVVAAVALRPLAFVSWERGDTYLARFLAGVALEIGGSVEIVRTGLDQSVAPGFHALLSVEVPLYGGGSTGGVALRLSARLLKTTEAKLALDSNGSPQVVQPDTAGQFFAAFAFYL